MIFFVVQQQIENHVLVPKVMSRQVGVSAVTVIVALLIGGKLLGISARSSRCRPPRSCRCCSPSGCATREVASRARGSGLEGSEPRGSSSSCRTSHGSRTSESASRVPEPSDILARCVTDPLAYLGDELNALKQQNLYRQLRVLDDEQKAHTTFDHRSVVNLSSNNYLGLTTHPRLRAAGARGGRDVRRRLRLGAHHRRHDGDPHGARAAARRVQEGRGGRRLPERLHGERRHGLGHPHQGRRRHLRRAESRQHHRRLPPEPRDDQGVPAQGRRRRAQDHRRSCRRASASCSSPTASSAWTATSGRCRRCASSPRRPAAS